MTPVEFSGFEIEASQNDDGMWYAQVRKRGNGPFIAGVGSGTLVEVPADTEDHAVEIAKGLIESGVITS